MKKTTHNGHLQRRAIPILKRKPILKQESISIEPIIEPILDPASQLKLNLLAEKEAELNQVLLIKEKSDALVKCFNELAEGITDLSKGAEGVSSTLRNWDTVFSIMGEMNHTENNEYPNWVRFEKSIISDNQQVITTERKRKLRE